VNVVVDSWLQLVALCGFAFLAGLIDAIAGGGGLIQLPALLIVLPQQPLASLLGTNKLASLVGTTVAVRHYARHIPLNWPLLLPACGAALICSALGARAVSLLNPSQLRPVILILLIAVAFYTARSKTLGLTHQPKLTPVQQPIAGALVGAALGLYDGFFGPGTGSFLMFIFISLFGFNFLAASAAAKVVNLATNLAAFAYFSWHGQVLYAIALPMALCNLLGAMIGARLAILKGSSFVRILFLGVVSVIIARFAYDTLVQFR
jgi:uncharacterized protein